MDSSRKDWSKRYGSADDERKSTYPRAGYNEGWGSSENEPYRYGGARPSSNDRGEPFYDTSREEYTDYRSGYSTANDFSEQRAPFERSRRSGRDYRGYSQEDLPHYRERYKRSEYPETYRSAMSGYMSEHVGADAGRRDYDQNRNQGNLYGNRYDLQSRRRQRDDEGGGERGYMREENYGRATRTYGPTTDFRSKQDQPRTEEGEYRGKGPRNYKRADNRIQEDINDRLTDDPFVDASEVDVAVKECEVILTGTVDSRDAKRRSETIAESVSGVKHIENRIKVRPVEDMNQPPLATPY